MNRERLDERVRRLRPANDSNPSHGYFGPDSIMWRVSREWVLQLAGVRAVLMQIAHPKVAQGVADHSNFQRAFIRRALNTYLAANDLIFGDCESAMRRAMKLHTMHSRVRGVLPESNGIGPREPYRALDQKLLLWVYATLVDSTVFTHDTFLGTLHAEEWDQYYHESKRLAVLLGIDPAVLPPRLPHLRLWVADMMASEVRVTSTSLALAEALRRGNLLVRLTQPAYYVVAVGSLPAELRQAYGVRDSALARAAYGTGAAVSRTLLPRLPAVLRSTPQAWLAYRRARR